jgi:hypothetical protein
MTKPVQWTDEDREDVAECIVDGIITNMTLEEMRTMCWDMLYSEVIDYPWSELWDRAEVYAPELHKYHFSKENL